MKILENVHVVLSIVIGLGMLINVYALIRGSFKLNKIKRQKDSILVGSSFWKFKFIILIIFNLIMLPCVFIPNGLIGIIILILLVFNYRNNVIFVWNDTLYTVSQSIRFKDIETIYKSKKRVRIVFHYGKGIKLKVKMVNSVVKAYESYILNNKKN